MFKKLCVKCLKALTEIPFIHGECVNLTISQQRLRIFIKYSKCFRRAVVHISTFKGEFRKQLLSVNLIISQQQLQLLITIVNKFARVTFGAVLFFQGIVFENSYCCEDLFELSNFCKDSRFFSKHHLQSSIF